MLNTRTPIQNSLDQDMVIFKYPVKIGGSFVLQLPNDAVVLSFQCQGGFPMLWVLLNSETDTVDRTFVVYGTGHPISEKKLDYIGTCQQMSGGFIWHLFEIETKRSGNETSDRREEEAQAKVPG